MAAALGIAQLLAQLLPLAVNAYKEIQTANSSELPPVETILAKADADWDAIAVAAQAQLAAPRPVASVPKPAAPQS